MCTSVRFKVLHEQQINHPQALMKCNFALVVILNVRCVCYSWAHGRNVELPILIHFSELLVFDVSGAEKADSIGNWTFRLLFMQPTIEYYDKVAVSDYRLQWQFWAITKAYHTQTMVWHECGHNDIFTSLRSCLLNPRYLHRLNLIMFANVGWAR